MSEQEDASLPPPGKGSPELEEMRQMGMPLTREAWLSLNYGTEPPEEWGPELEATLPPELQDWSPWLPNDQPAMELTVPSSTPSSDAAGDSSPTPSARPSGVDLFRRMVEAGPPPVLPEPDEKDPQPD